HERNTTRAAPRPSPRRRSVATGRIGGASQRLCDDPRRGARAPPRTARGGGGGGGGMYAERRERRDAIVSRARDRLALALARLLMALLRDDALAHMAVDAAAERRERA